MVKGVNSLHMGLHNHYSRPLPTVLGNLLEGWPAMSTYPSASLVSACLICCCFNGTTVDLFLHSGQVVSYESRLM